MKRLSAIVTGMALLSAAPARAQTPYSLQLSQLAQRYFRMCRAERLLLDAESRQFNEKHLPMPPVTSFREALPPAERRDAELVCLGAALQNLDDTEEAWKHQQADAPPTPADPQPQK